MIRRDLVLADDLTGALEAGALYAAAGIGATVHIGKQLRREDRTTAVVLDLETRHAAPEPVRSIFAEATQSAQAAGIDSLYLKVDSTMRGPIGSAIEGVLQAWPDCLVLLAPAYPSMGRIVRGGIVYVDGQPLAETAYSHDPLNPSRTSRVADYLGDVSCASVFEVASSSELRTELSREKRSRLFVCDAETQQDLADLASIVAQYRGACVCVGSSGLLGELIRRYHETRAQTGLIVVGSLHTASRDQCVAAGAETPVTEVADEDTDRSITESLLNDLTMNGWAILTTGPRRDDCAGTAQRLAKVAAAVLQSMTIDSVVVFGGDTAAAILKNLGVRTIHPVRELLPGIPASHIVTAGRSMLLVTKAGGFGDRNVISRIKAALAGKE